MTVLDTARRQTLRRTLTGPAVVLCAWCARHGSRDVAARYSGTSTWDVVSCAAARALEAAGLASHGVCTTCLPRIAQDWELHSTALESAVAAAGA